MEGHLPNFNDNITWQASCAEPTITFKHERSNFSAGANDFT